MLLSIVSKAAESSRGSSSVICLGNQHGLCTLRRMEVDWKGYRWSVSPKNSWTCEFIYICILRILVVEGGSEIAGDCFIGDENAAWWICFLLGSSAHNAPGSWSPPALHQRGHFSPVCGLLPVCSLALGQMSFPHLLIPPLSCKWHQRRHWHSVLWEGGLFSLIQPTKTLLWT